MSQPSDPIERLRADYDTTPYVSEAFPQSAPGRLAAIAHVFGLDAPAVSTARVLEIGCAAGGNLIPFAAWHPRAQVVGIDLSQVQIDQGRSRVAALGLENLELVAGDIARTDLAALGQFDYVVVHGVYSWVPEHVQAAVLSTINQVMSPTGVAYLSYNTYPGWKSKEVMRDAMMLASGASTTPEEKVRTARQMVDFLADVTPADGVLARVLAEFRSRDEGFADSYLLHDELEAVNAPCYFYEMVGRAAAHGLTYLADARPETMFPANHGPAVAEHLQEKCGGVHVLVEQYLDFVTNRTFRESLFVHAHRAPQIRHDLTPSRFEPLHFASWSPPVDGPTVLDHSRQEYEVGSGATLFTNDPGLKAALEALNARWPWTLSRHELVDAVHGRLVSAGLSPSATLGDHVDNLMGVLIAQGHASYRLDPVLPEPSSVDSLRLDPATRRMTEATSGQPDGSIFNRWHETISPSPLDRSLLPLLDGTTDRAALADFLVDTSDAEQLDTLPQRLVEMKLIRVD